MHFSKLVLEKIQASQESDLLKLDTTLQLKEKYAILTQNF